MALPPPHPGPTPGLGVLSTTQDGRVLFLLPWEGQTIAGTTDNKCDLVAEPAATASEVKFILREVWPAWHCERAA